MAHRRGNRLLIHHRQSRLACRPPHRRRGRHRGDINRRNRRCSWNVVLCSGCGELVWRMAIIASENNFTAHSSYSQTIQDGWLACPSLHLLA